MKRLFIILLVFAFGRLFSQEKYRYDKAGLAVQVGVGAVIYGGLGGLVEYQTIYKEKIRITPFGGGSVSQLAVHPPTTL